MDEKTNHPMDLLATARQRCEEDRLALERVRSLLGRADARRIQEPDEARKWNRVLENLECSLDLTRARYELSEANVKRLEQEAGRLGVAEPMDVVAVPGPEGDQADAWRATLRSVEGLTLEEASLLQSDIDAGTINDAQLEAGLALANQLRDDPEEAPESSEHRRQFILRAAIDKISRRRYDQMSLDEIKLVLACHSLLTSRLEPTARDQRLRRILDGAVKILQRRKVQMERVQGGNLPK